MDEIKREKREGKSDLKTIAEEGENTFRKLEDNEIIIARDIREKHSKMEIIESELRIPTIAHESSSREGKETVEEDEQVIIDIAFDKIESINETIDKNSSEQLIHKDDIIIPIEPLFKSESEGEDKTINIDTSFSFNKVVFSLKPLSVNPEFYRPRPISRRVIDMKNTIIEGAMSKAYGKILVLSVEPQFRIIGRGVRFYADTNMDHRIEEKFMEETITKITGGSGHGREELVFYDPLRIVFEALSLENINLAYPVLIIATKPSNDSLSYIEFLKRVLRELYRVLKGGLPKPIDTGSSLSLFKYYIKAENSVYVVYTDYLDRLGKHLDVIKERISELYSQGLGFIVFYGTETSLTGGDLLNIIQIDYSLNTWNPIGYSPPFGYYPGPISIKPLGISKQVLIRVIDAFWGLFEYHKLGGKKLVENEKVSVDAYVMAVESEYYNRLSKIVMDPQIQYNVKESRDSEDPQGESFTHYALKALLYNYFIKRKNKYENVETEKQPEECNIFIDVYVETENKKIAVEVETLYGTVIPIRKLLKTFKSRENCKDKIDELWIVIPPPQALLFYRHLLYFEKKIKNKENLKTKLYTIDVLQGKPVPLKKIGDYIRSHPVDENPSHIS